ncbi:MAG TPA: formate dehydrogenase accessory sulfurtransferase FdhD [Gemmatimonadaceae bacterium]|nr:formate dehydrogenase accessory sulfurtransferase FdhD [Gemmatimonadaceae bacterium]
MATARTELPSPDVGYADALTTVPMLRIGDGGVSSDEAAVAEEVPVALVYNGRSHVVVMATPADLEDLAVGFSLTESVVASAAEIEHLDVVRASHGIELQMAVPAERAAALQDRSRGIPARTSCGLCGVESIAELLRAPERVPHTLAVARDAIFRAAHELGASQKLNNETNTVHAAAWADPSGEIRLAREDVGRHNALDKLLGALARAGTPANAGFVLVTSRASYEMVQKCAVRGVELLAAISRPTGLAIRFAQASGVTLVGLVRGRSANVYIGHQRLT